MSLENLISRPFGISWVKLPRKQRIGHHNWGNVMAIECGWWSIWPITIEKSVINLPHLLWSGCKHFNGFPISHSANWRKLTSKLTSKICEATTDPTLPHLDKRDYWTTLLQNNSHQQRQYVWHRSDMTVEEDLLETILKNRTKECGKKITCNMCWHDKPLTSDMKGNSTWLMLLREQNKRKNRWYSCDTMDGIITFYIIMPRLYNKDYSWLALSIPGGGLLSLGLMLL